MNTLTQSSQTSRFWQAAYGMAFILLLPAFLSWMAWRIDLPLPAFHLPALGAAFSALGSICMASAMRALIVRGKGLPMNAFPPRNLVTAGLYGLLPHPIYCGFIFLALGISLLTGSASGLWLITPLCILGCAALVWGYERPYLIKAHRDMARPWLGLPVRYGFMQRMGMMCGVLLPWLALFYAIKFLGAPPDASTLLLPGESGWPVLAFTYPLYASAYVFVPLAFFIAPENAAKRLFLRGWLSLAVMGALYLCVPLVSPVRAFVPENFLGMLLQWEMLGAYPYTAAFPSYHVVWSVLAAAAIAERGKIWGVWAWCMAFGISLTCVTTGMHVFADIPAGLAIAFLLCRQESIWGWLLRSTQRLANSLRAYVYGPLRIWSHAPYSFLAGFICLCLPSLLLGQEYVHILGGLMLAGLVASALWGKAVEGASRLQRPFGYFGAVAGLALCAGLFRLWGLPVWPLASAIACAAPWLQAAGRLRCIVQGCCHGRAIDREYERSCRQTRGICVSNPASRVCGLSKLHGMEIFPTQLYSILGNILSGILLLRLWQLGAEAAWITGLYFVFSGLLRFVEEGYRGESQTPFYYGLPIYQWLAVGMAFSGCCLLCMPSPSVGLFHVSLAASATFTTFAWSAASGLLAAFAMSMDFPSSNRAFARLSCD